MRGLWYNLLEYNPIKDGRSGAGNTLRPDTRKDDFLMQLHFTIPISTTEQWREIPGSDGRYEVSDRGCVRSWFYNRAWRATPHYKPLRTTKAGYGYYALSFESVTKNCFAHRLVMLAFVGPSRLGVNHKDGNKLNNSLDNLEYMTQRENIRHAREVLGTWRPVTPRQTPETDRDRRIRAMAMRGMTQQEIADRIGISRSYVSHIVTGRVRPSEK